MRTRRLPDLALGMLGVAFGAPSLAWPFGWDTSVHYYVGREWVLRGAVPYRDTFDHKTPGIHMLHALCILLFGERMVGIRVVELACVVAIGWACGALASGRRKPPHVGMRGACVLAASVLYYGFFDYWNTAQCELVGSTLAVLTLAAAARLRMRRASVVAGVLTGALLVLKPPFVIFGVLAACLLWGRARGEAVRGALSVFALGIAAVVLPIAAYFVVCGAGPAMVEILVGANLVYLTDEPRVTTAAGLLGELGNAQRFFAPVSTLVLGAGAVAAIAAVVSGSRERRRRWGLTVAAGGAAFAVVLVQMKLYHYHWSFAVAPMTLVVANVVVDVQRAAGFRATRRPTVAALASAALVIAFTRTGVQLDGWLRSSTAVVAWVTGRTTRERFASSFQTWDGLRKYGELEAAGLWLKERAAPDDLVLSRGIDAEIYVVSGHRAPGRFFWTAFLTRDSRRFHRERWLAEDLRTILDRRPRWVVAWGPDTSGPDSTYFFEQLGYVQRRRFGPHVILERGARAN